MNAITKTETNALAPMNEQELMKVLQSSLYPGAAVESIKMVLGYCRASGLDPMQKPVHIVPMWDSKARQMRDVVMPGVNLYRTQAMRSGGCAGVSEPDFGPDKTEKIGGQEITFPAWCRVTVKRRLPTGEIVDFTAREFWKENYAVKGGQDKSIAPNAMWTKRPYGQIAKCFDTETEVLTTSGFQRFSEVTGKILQVTPSGMAPCDAVPFSQLYDGEMIVADGSRLNFCVTPNHDMITTSGKIEAGAMFDQATKMGNKFHVPRAPSAPLQDEPFPDGVLKLAGYYLADGSHTGYKQFRIAVSRSRKVEALRELALHQRESIKAEAGDVAVANGREIVTAHDKTVFTYDFGLVSGLVTADKSLNVEVVLSLSRRQARVVADALLEFDGNETTAGVRRLTQTNPNVMQGFELLAVHGGLSVSARTLRKSDIGSSFSITVSESDHFPVVKGVEKNSASLVKRKNIQGTVWCVTVPSGVIVVRRRGFSMLCGNCAEAQALRKAFPEIASQPTADEMEGKPMQPDDGFTANDSKPAASVDLLDKANIAADGGRENFAAWWKACNAADRASLREHLASLKARTEQADKARTVDAPAAEPTAKTFDEVMAALCAAMTEDALHTAAACIDALESEEEREMLNRKFDEVLGNIRS